MAFIRSFYETNYGCGRLTRHVYDAIAVRILQSLPLADLAN